MTIDSKEMPATMEHLLSLVEHEIPEGQNNLKQSFNNLEKVADYCESNYFNAENKKHALEETKNYTTQSLASVAFQINTLAFNLLQMLDLQDTQMADMQCQVNQLSQQVDNHKEKVARREIGVLATNKNHTRRHKVIVPLNPERSIKYVRKPIDYSILDDIGHGVKIPQQQSIVSRTGTTKRGSIPGMNGSSHYMQGGFAMAGVVPPPTTKPPTPPSGRAGMGSLSRASREYRTPAPPIAPPQVPSNYAPNYPIGHPRSHDTISRRGSQYSTLPLNSNYASGSSILNRQSSGHYGTLGPNSGVTQQPSQSQMPQVGMVHPMSQGASSGHGLIAVQSPTPPPPPPPDSTIQNSISTDSLPAPPSTLHPSASTDQSFDRSGHSPPLPPPPAVEEGNENDWIPHNYIEKVIASYDYAAIRFDELSFSENSVIYVIKKNEDGWWEGVLNGITGLFPGNYVEPCL